MWYEDYTEITLLNAAYKILITLVNNRIKVYKKQNSLINNIDLGNQCPH